MTIKTAASKVRGAIDKVLHRRKHALKHLRLPDWDKPFTRGRFMRPEDIGMRFQDVYEHRFGIAVAINEQVYDHSSSSGPKHMWLVIGMDGSVSNIHNCHVEAPAEPGDRPYYG